MTLENKDLRLSIYVASKANDEHGKYGEQQDLSPGVQRSTILILNDDCLLAVLSHLSSKDLCAIADCCCRLSNIADDIMEKRMKNKQLEHWHPCSNSWPDQSDVVRKILRRSIEFTSILEHFGRFIHHLNITSDLLREDFWQLLGNCTELKTLTLKRASLHLIPVSDMGVMFEQLKELRLFRCFSLNWGYEKLLDSCKSLKKLVIFVKREGMSKSASEDPTDDLLQIIAQHKMDIESIEFSTRKCSDRFIDNVSQLKTLKKLKRLVLECYNQPIGPAIEALASNDSLQDMTLYGAHEDENGELMSALDKFRTLKKCHITFHVWGASLPGTAMYAMKNFDVAEYTSDTSTVSIFLKRKKSSQ